MDDYGQELAAIADGLQTCAMTCSVRGSGAARFVFAACGPRSVELSRNGTEWWTEFWTGEDAIADKTFSSAEEAVGAARGWLSSTGTDPATT
jgi:hypothetical protein